MQKPPLLRRFLNNDLYNLDNKYSQLLWKVFHGLWTCILMRPFYNILYFFGGQKWGDIMFHGYHREMLYIIGYLLRNGGLAWNKKVMGFLSIFVFLLSLETLILFALTLPLLLLSFFFSPWWPLLKTQPFKVFVLVELRSHITYSK
jgi:hypothetical protein